MEWCVAPAARRNDAISLYVCLTVKLLCSVRSEIIITPCHTHFWQNNTRDKIMIFGLRLHLLMDEMIRCGVEPGQPASKYIAY